MTDAIEKVEIGMATKFRSARIEAHSWQLNAL
jgi:hypothetical protein